MNNEKIYYLYYKQILYVLVEIFCSLGHLLVVHVFLYCFGHNVLQIQTIIVEFAFEVLPIALICAFTCEHRPIVFKIVIYKHKNTNVHGLAYLSYSFAISYASRHS